MGRSDLSKRRRCCYYDERKLVSVHITRGIEMRRLALQYSVSLLAIVSLSCSVERVSLPDKVILPDKSRYLPYSFEYKSTNVQEKIDLTLAFVSPVFGISREASGAGNISVGEPFFGKEIAPEDALHVDRLLKSYLAALQTDFEKVLLLYGFRTTGPFGDRERMTYPQREQADLAFEPRVFIDVFVHFSEIEKPQWVEKPLRTFIHRERRAPDLPETQFTIRAGIQKEIYPGTVTGFIVVKPRIDLHLYEPLSWEKMWIKSVTPPMSDSLPYAYRYNDEGGRRLYGEDTRPNALAKALAQSYKNVLDEFTLFFDPREIRPLNAKAKVVRERKRF